jgi:hypothetical protein
MTGVDAVPDSETLAGTVADLERRLRLLEDERELRELMTRYAQYADLAYGERYVGVYTETGAIDLESGRFEGRHSLFHDFVIGRVTHRWPGRMQHWTLGPLLFTIDGDEAQATGYSLVVGRTEDGILVVRSVSVNRWRFVRQDGKWLVQERLLRSLGSVDQAKVLGLDRDDA